VALDVDAIAVALLAVASLVLLGAPEFAPLAAHVLAVEAELVKLAAGGAGGRRRPGLDVLFLDVLGALPRRASGACKQRFFVGMMGPPARISFLFQCPWKSTILCRIMTDTTEPPIPTCPSCGAPACRKVTRFGIRDACNACGLHSWNGKELVSERVHRARQDCHDKFDPLWEDVSWMALRHV
jgi:hypothetical protein